MLFIENVLLLLGIWMALIAISVPALSIFDVNSGWAVILFLLYPILKRPYLTWAIILILAAIITIIRHPLE